MGVIISTNSTLAPISFASSVVGFVSFAFTLATFLKVVWQNLITLAESSHNVHSYLNNLRQEILEERANLRVLRKSVRRRKRRGGGGGVGAHGHGDDNNSLPDAVRDLVGIELDDVALKTMGDVVRHLTRQFEDIERPFLAHGEEGIAQARHRGIPGRGQSRRRQESPSPHYAHSTYPSPPEEKPGRGGERRYRGEQDREHERDDEDELFWAQRVHYARYTLVRRVNWLFRRSQAQELFGTLSRLQTRRIAREISSLGIMVRGYGNSISTVEGSSDRCDERLARIDERLGRIDDRLNRVVGVRRID